MMRTKPDLVILPFKAVLTRTGTLLTLDQTLRLLRSQQKELVRIERSHPGATDAICWSIFLRTPEKYRYENEPLFRFERGARKHIRKAYAIYYSLLGDDGMTYSHLHL